MLLWIVLAGSASAQSDTTRSDATPAESLPSAWSAPEPWRTDRFFLETSVYTVHFDSDPSHDNSQSLILGEWNVTEQWLLGASFFDNSFGQSSQYVYGGFRFRPFDSLQQRTSRSRRLVHGYLASTRTIFQQIRHRAGNHSVECIDRFYSEVVIFGTAGYW
jgi:hypothetical protein